MVKIIVWNLMTLNGYFNGVEDWQLDWHNQVWGEELEQFSLLQLHEIDMLMFGRKTYEGMAAYWQSAPEEQHEIADLMNKIPKIVFSRTLESATWNNTKLIREDAVDYIQQELKPQSDNKGKYFIFGSADLISSLYQAKLIDEYRLCIAPVVLGNGIPMFKQHDFDMEFNLKETRVLNSGGILMWLTPKTT